MKQMSVVRSWYVGPALLVAVMMTGCAGQAVSTPAGVGGEEVNAGTVIDASYSDALEVRDQLVLGTMRLEGGEHAVTLEQAAALLPLWQVIQGGTLQGDSEVNAVLSQIEDQMTSEQLAAIAAMQLTQEDLQTWMQEQGMRMGVEGDPGQRGAGQNMSEEEQAEFGITEGDNPGVSRFGAPGSFAKRCCAARFCSAARPTSALGSSRRDNPQLRGCCRSGGNSLD